MPHYLISYDLRAPGRNYEGLYKALAAAKAVRALESLWLLDDPKTSAAVRDTLRSHVDQNDGVVVIELNSSNWATYSPKAGAAEWLKARFP
jgi:ABC-type transport system involved in cytochrome c biogenesis ATPase subunit